MEQNCLIVAGISGQTNKKKVRDSKVCRCCVTPVAGYHTVNKEFMVHNGPLVYQY